MIMGNQGEACFRLVCKQWQRLHAVVRRDEPVRRARNARAGSRDRGLFEGVSGGGVEAQRAPSQECPDGPRTDLHSEACLRP